GCPGLRQLRHAGEPCLSRTAGRIHLFVLAGDGDAGCKRWLYAVNHQQFADGVGAPTGRSVCGVARRDAIWVCPARESAAEIASRAGIGVADRGDDDADELRCVFASTGDEYQLERHGFDDYRHRGRFSRIAKTFKDLDANGDELRQVKNMFIAGDSAGLTMRSPRLSPPFVRKGLKEVVSMRLRFGVLVIAFFSFAAVAQTATTEPNRPQTASHGFNGTARQLALSDQQKSEVQALLKAEREQRESIR